MEKHIHKTKHDDSYFSLEAIHYASGNPVRIEIEGNVILKITQTESLEKEEKVQYVAPGLFDNQINGYANVDFSGNDFSPEDVLYATRAIWKEGVTSFLPTLITNSQENLIKNFRVLSEALDKYEQLRNSIPGFHLEGPYISHVEGYRGCHPVQYIRKPSWEEFTLYQEAAGGRIIQVTLAPEVEGAQQFIKLCTRNNIITAIGHSEATSEQIKSAVENGATLSTHLGNGCANYIHRHNNPIWPQLANDILIPSVIADGHHLSSDEIKVFYKVKGPENIILTSDITYLAGMPPGKYTFLGSEVLLTDEGMLLNQELNCLAGASFPLKKGIENMMNFTGCSLTRAVDMASGNVARVYNLFDRGTIAEGRRADLILFERDGNQLHIKKTIMNGRIVCQE